MATTTQLLLILFCLPSLSLAGRQMEGTGKLVANHEEDAVDTQQKWNYSTAKTAWDVLCHGITAGLNSIEWEETNCGWKKLKSCSSLVFKCDPDVRVHNITIDWSRNSQKPMILPKNATPVTKVTGEFFRFFLESEGCPGGGKSDKDCELPWEVFNEERAHTKKVGITRRFLVYDVTIPGTRAVSVETNKYDAKFEKSKVENLGTGIPLPTSPVYAGASGTGCGTGLDECSKPVSGPEPVDKTTEIVVKTNFLVELEKRAPGNVSLMTNHNWAKTTRTEVEVFKWAWTKK